MKKWNKRYYIVYYKTTSSNKIGSVHTKIPTALTIIILFALTLVGCASEEAEKEWQHFVQQDSIAGYKYYMTMRISRNYRKQAEAKLREAEQRRNDRMVELREEIEVRGTSDPVASLFSDGRMNWESASVSDRNGSNSEDTTIDVVKKLGEIKGDFAVKLLIFMLDYSWYSPVRCNAAEALGEIKDSRAVEPLIYALKYSSDYSGSYVRKAAAEALGKINDSRAVEPLIIALYDKEDAVRIEAAWALSEIKDSRAVEPLINLLQYSSGPSSTRSFVRGVAAKALGKINDSRAVEPLIIASLADDDSSADTYLIPLFSIKTSLSHSLEPWLSALQDSDPKVRKQAAYLLGAIGNLQAVDSLISVVLNDSDAYVRKKAAWALSIIRDDKSIRTLMDAIENKDLPVIAGACRFFIREGDESAIYLLIQALNNYGDRSMAEVYINCDNYKLSQAGGTWAKSKGYTIMRMHNNNIDYENKWGNGINRNR